jgi:hypothetical protein
MSVYEIRANNIGRPLNWRWQRAGFVLAGETVGRGQLDAASNKAVELRRRLDMCRTDRDRDRLAIMMPDEFEVWSLYAHEGPMTIVKWAMEARIIANEMVSDIAQKAGLTEAQVNLYHDWFFDIRKWLKSPDRLVPLVFSRPARDGEPIIDYPCALRLVGYYGGPQTLDNLLHVLSSNETSQIASLFYNEQGRVLLARRAFMALLTTRNSWQANQHFIDAWQSDLALQKTDDQSTMQERAVTSTVGVFFDQMPWQKAHTYVQLNSPGAAIEQSFSTGMRDAELAVLAAAGQLPETTRLMMQSAEETPF